MKDMVSIIIPLYNRQDVIMECIQSINAQSYQNFEIILIDDGSSDQTPEVCRELANENPRVKHLSIAHAGVSAARNHGIEAATGEYIFFVDSDDVIHPLLLEALVDGLKNSDAAIAGTGVISVPEKNWRTVSEDIKKNPGPGETTYNTHQESLHAIFHSMSPLNMIGGVMIRRDLIGATRFNPELIIGEDFYFIYQNLIKGASSIFLRQKWYYSRLHANNSSWNFGFDGFWSRFHRRELVWKSEESLGRKENADREKQNAFGIYLNCYKRNPLYSADCKKMRKLMKGYKKILFPALTPICKVRYYLSIYMPSVYKALSITRHKLKK